MNTATYQHTNAMLNSQQHGVMLYTTNAFLHPGIYRSVLEIA